MKIKLFISLIGSALFIFSSSSFAKSDRSMEQVYKECGLGGHLFGNSSPTLAFISNVTWDLGTTAASSDSTDACIDKEETTALFIHQTFEILEQEIAQGRGEYFDTLVTVMDCTSLESYDVMAAVRSEFSDVVNTDNYADMTRTEKASALYSVVAPKLATGGAASCVIS